MALADTFLLWDWCLEPTNGFVYVFIYLKTGCISDLRGSTYIILIDNENYASIYAFFLSKHIVATSRFDI